MIKQLAYIIYISCILMFYGCNGRTGQFTVSGVVTGAEDQMIYFENVGLSEVLLLDSAKLNGTGKFIFKEKIPEYPEFYRLRMNGQYINLAIDSAESITITADYTTFATSYQVEGSLVCSALKEITLAQLDANQAIHRLRKDFEAGVMPDSIYRIQTLAAIETYRDTARRYIYSRPMSPEAYFALFQQIDGMLFFDPYDKEDSRAYGAVATSYNHLYPESPRSKHLYNLALQALKVIRSQRDINLDNIDVKEIDFMDVALPNLRGDTIKLTEMAKGKVVILNFTSYQAEWSDELNQLLHKADSTYRGRNFGIYQISLDSDVHLWKNVAANLPWTCVRDPQTVYSQAAAIYNVKQLPALFLLNSKGLLVKRIDNLDTLIADIGNVF
ncbi:MAG: DUF4369 domain-containing protein [Tannerella sp.]|nr:DUF4369 domain-containing protein [Tannerella sp.]